MKRFMPFVLILAMLAAALAGCDKAGTETQESEEEKQVVQSIYTIVRGDNCSKEETDGAVRLRNTLEEYGIKAELVTDWIKRDQDVEDHRYPNEIVFGDTNRNESIAAYETLNIGKRGMVDYSVTSDAEDYILAAAPGYVDEAVDVLLAVLTEDLTRLESAPVAVDDSRTHAFPMEDISICGVSVEEYDYILYKNTYDAYMINDLERLSDLIFQACGTRIPVNREAPIYEGRCIHVGRQLSEQVQAGGDFSCGMIPSEDGLILEGKDVWNDWVAVDTLITAIENGMEAGGVLDISEPVLRITDLAEDDPLAVLQLAAWVISSTEMTAEEQFAEIAECGFNQVIIQVPGDDGTFHNFAKWMAKYQLRGLWHDDAHYLENWQRNEGAFLSNEPYLNDSITWGHMLRDEPNAEMYADLTQMFAQYEADAPGKVPFINLFPIYANADQMKVPTYQEYVDQFFETVNPWYASVDIYPLNVGNHIIDNYFVNLDIFSTACRERSVPFGVYIQTVSFNVSKRTPVEQEMRWQAYNALAFGATNIEYFTYRTPNSTTEDFKNALIARDNTRTERWYGAQNLNSELTVMGDAFMQYNHLGCWRVNPANAPKFFYFNNEYTGFDAIAGVTVTDNKSLLMGGFAAKDGDGSAFICVNADDPGTGTAPIDVKVQLADGYTGAVIYQMGKVSEVAPAADGTISFTLTCGEGVFVELKH